MVNSMTSGISFQSLIDEARIKDEENSKILRRDMKSSES